LFQGTTKTKLNGNTCKTLPYLSVKFFCSCDACGKSFVDKRSLMRHAKIHATNKPFPCLHCDKGYVDANSLRKHMRNHECEVSGGAPQLPTI
jgi:hypothetical protein